MAPSCEALAGHFPRLEILELLGQGGMGAVYKARQKMLDRTVALKILPPESGRDPAFAERFTREARAMARLTHPNIVMVFEFGEADGLYYLIMEYVDGVNLRQAMQAGELTAAEALAIVPQICEALQFAHEEGIVHRDIKPENVLVDKRGRVKIADFGLAKLLRGALGDITLTATHQIMGTLRYMAPEQIEHPLQVDHRADIYSLGVVFYELLTGELPLGRFSLPSEKRPLDSRLDQVVLKTLERQPEQRYQHASEVKVDVESITRGSASAAAPPPARRPPPVQAIPPVQTAPAGGNSPPSREPIVRVPFAIHDLYGGFAKAHGILRFDGRVLKLEFQIRDQLFNTLASEVKCVELPLDQILSIQLQTGLVRTRIRIQCDNLRAVASLPKNERGVVTLHVERGELGAAEHIVGWVRHQLGISDEPYVDAGVSSPSLSSAATPPRPIDRESVRRSLSAPALTLSMLGCANMLPLVIVLMSLVFHFLVSADVSGAAWGNKAAFDSHSFEGMPIWILVMLFASVPGVLMVAGGICLKATRHRGVVVLGAIAAMLPISPLWLISFLIGIWVLARFSQRGVGQLFAEQLLERRYAGSSLADGHRDRGPEAYPEKSSVVSSSRRPLHLPAILLLVSGILNGAVCIGLALLLIVDMRSGTSARPAVMGIFFLLAPGAIGSTIVFGAAHMLVGRSLAVSRLAAILALVPCTPIWLLSAPSGILALWRMSDPRVRALFVR